MGRITDILIFKILFLKSGHVENDMTIRVLQKVFREMSYKY